MFHFVGVIKVYLLLFFFLAVMQTILCVFKKSDIVKCINGFIAFPQNTYTAIIQKRAQLNNTNFSGV